MNLHYDDSKDLSEGEIIEIDGDSQNQVAIILPNFREKYGRLFATAPDLYEACKQALIHSEIPTDSLPIHVIKQLEQALAKVEK